MKYLTKSGDHDKVRNCLLYTSGTHDIELDQAGSLHLLIVDGTFGIFCKIAYIYGPGSVIGRKKRLYLVQKVVHAGIRIVCESASAGWRKSSLDVYKRQAIDVKVQRGIACAFIMDQERSPKYLYIPAVPQMAFMRNIFTGASRCFILMLSLIHI